MDLKKYEYFRTDLGVLYNCDCLTIMPQLERVDLVLTDPPYGMKYCSGHYKYGNPFSEIAGDERFPSEIIPVLIEKSKKATFVFCRWDNLIDVPQPKSFIVWVKNNWSAGDLKKAFGRMWEGILFYPNERHEFKKRIPDVIDFKRIPPTQIVHPTQKPVLLYDWLIGNTSKETELVFDPFFGSGTCGVACEKINRRWIGIEISEKYCEIAAKRIEDETAQLKLFK